MESSRPGYQSAFDEKNRDRWVARITEIRDEAGWSATQLAAKVGLPSTTLSGAMKTNSKFPSLDVILAIAEAFDYPVSAQIADLTGKEREWIVPPSEEQAAFASKLELFNRIESALDVAGQRGPSVADLVRRVLESSAREAPIPSEGLSSAGRWRARLFDVPMGWRFPHVGYHGVEFMRWYGPNRGRSEDVYPSRLWWERSGQSSDRVRRMASKVWFQNKRPSHFQSEDSEWDAFRFERTELLHRMQPLFARARLSTYGDFGFQYAALLRHSDDAGPRHIFTQMTPNTTPDLTASLGCHVGKVRTILVVGHPSARPIAIGARLAEAMAWQLTEFRQLQAHLTGQRPRISQHVQITSAAATSEVDLVWDRLAGLTASRIRPMVVPVNAQYLLHGRGLEATLSPAARRALEDPHTMVVMLNTPFSVEPTAGHTGDGWESSAELHSQRSKDLDFDNRDSAIHNEAVAEFIPGLIVNSVSDATRLTQATVLPTYLHAGDAYYPAGQSRSFPHFLWHPTIGDIDVRAAFEIGHYLAQGRAIASSGPRSRVDFAPGSVVRRHQQALRAMTGGNYWNPGNELHSRHAEAHFSRPEVIAPPPDDGTRSFPSVSPYYGSRTTRAVRIS